jgi:flavin reductase (DIM6/NTAB) family NADH-FMN oxidoreductase RutF
MTDPTRTYKDALSSWATGVTVVAAEVDDLLYGITVTSFTSVSLEPPLVLVCLKSAGILPAMIQQTSGFTVSVLARDQEEQAGHFALSGREAELRLHDGMPGVWSKAGRPIVQGAVAWLCCDLHDTLVSGDHTVFVGEVIEAVSDDTREPLIYCRRGYRGLDGSLMDPRSTEDERESADG